MIQKFLTREFILFLITGGFAALVNFSSRIFYNQWMSFSASIVLAYITGMITAFLLARWLVFKKSERSFLASAVWFCAVNVFAVIQTWLISMGLASYLLPYWGVTVFVHEIAHGVGVIAPVFTSFLGHKYFSFRD